ncbi:MAG: DMT family transporter, partial [Rhodocyclaceae bacterium]|nr:DMT family transporter [Rhodocyclaceae bacterium]
MKKSGIMQAAGLLLIATLAWGGMFPVAKSVLPQIDPFHLTLLRYGPTSLMLLALLALREGRTALRPDGQGWALVRLGTLGFAGFGLFAFVGLRHTRPEHAAIVMALLPLAAVLMNWARRGLRPARATLYCIGLALAGVLLVVTKGQLGMDFIRDGGWGDLLIIAGAFSWVLYTMGAAQFPDWSALRYTALTCIAGVPAIVGATLVATWLGLSQLPEPAALREAVPALAYLIVLCSVVAVLAWNSGNRRIGAENGVLFINFVPVTAFGIGLAQG